MVNETDTAKRISVTMISNAMNHHQFPFCDSMAEIEDVSFRFIATKPIAKERLQTGFKDLNDSRPYIVRAYASEEEKAAALSLAENSDFVIYGSAPFFYIKNRIKRKKWTFLYSERLFKEVRGGDFLYLRTIAACTLRYAFNSHKRLRLLCASAFSSNDYRFFRFKPAQTYTWGYFPPVGEKTFSELYAGKTQAGIVWIGRMISWKHPELAVALAERLRAAGVSFQMTMIGGGPLEKTLKERVAQHGLEDYVRFSGVLGVDQARKELEKSQIMIATSDRNEGWGAVVNEGMSGGCAVVASHLMGSVPYLIKHGENGLIFESGNADDLFRKVKDLLTNNELCGKLSQNAYNTISEEWNGRVAAERLAELFRRYQIGQTAFSYKSGICSHTKRFSDRWIKRDPDINKMQ